MKKIDNKLGVFLSVSDIYYERIRQGKGFHAFIYSFANAFENEDLLGQISAV